MRAPAIHRVTPRCLLLKWKSAHLTEVSEDIRTYSDWLRANFSSELLEVTPAYTELAIYLNAESHAEPIQKALETFSLDAPQNNSNKIVSRKITIPVCYEGEFASDIERVAKFNQLSIQQVIKLHSEATYTVAFIGFLPGFPYVTGLPDALHTPRLSSPRPRITAGSVGIGGNQTGVYPQDSPGGWNIIGRTPIPLFNPLATSPALLQAGDTLCFQPIDRSKFDDLTVSVRKGTFDSKIDVHD
ncbi:MAG: 5-oxoprolinase subunit PxpB [Marinirhabdus sp.]|nr:5-oxoprolinase subunit PxpB [Marinirhabdus sp.]